MAHLRTSALALSCALSLSACGTANVSQFQQDVGAPVTATSAMNYAELGECLYKMRSKVLYMDNSRPVTRRFHDKKEQLFRITREQHIGLFYSYIAYLLEVTPDPTNPSGSIVSSSDRKVLIRFATVKEVLDSEIQACETAVDGGEKVRLS